MEKKVFSLTEVRPGHCIVDIHEHTFIRLNDIDGKVQIPINCCGPNTNIIYRFDLTIADEVNDV